MSAHFFDGLVLTVLTVGWCMLTLVQLVQKLVGHLEGRKKQGEGDKKVLTRGNNICGDQPAQ